MFQKKLCAIALITSQCLLATTSLAGTTHVFTNEDTFAESEMIRLNNLSGRCHFPKDKTDTLSLSINEFEALCAKLATMATECIDTESGSFKVIKQLQIISSELMKFDITSEMSLIRDEATESILKALGYDNGKLDTCVRFTDTLQELSLLVKYQIEHLAASEAYTAECLTPRANLITTEYHSWMTMENALIAVAGSLIAVAAAITYRYRKVHGNAPRTNALVTTGVQASVGTLNQDSQASTVTLGTVEQAAQTINNAANALVDTAVGSSRTNTPVPQVLDDSAYDDDGFGDDGTRTPSPTLEDGGPAAMSTPMQAAVAGVQNVVHGVVQDAVNGARRFSTDTIREGIAFLTGPRTGGRQLRERGADGTAITESAKKAAMEMYNKRNRLFSDSEE